MNRAIGYAAVAACAWLIAGNLSPRLIVPDQLAITHTVNVNVTGLDQLHPVVTIDTPTDFNIDWPTTLRGILDVTGRVDTSGDLDHDMSGAVIVIHRQEGDGQDDSGLIP